MWSNFPENSPGEIGVEAAVVVVNKGFVICNIELAIWEKVDGKFRWTMDGEMVDWGTGEYSYTDITDRVVAFAEYTDEVIKRAELRKEANDG